jgi:class 3 adenylate cyclase
MEKAPDAAAPGRERRRRLRAVFAADAANFGGLVSVDETKTLDSLWTTRRIATQELGKHGGWLFGMPGDGIFALFESSVDAVRCALDIQGRLAEQPAATILNLRVGIHLGEVLFQDELPFGEALVIAARLEGLAEPGGILVSQSVMEAVAPRIQAVFVDQGVRSLKHSPRQIKTYTVHPPGARKEEEPPPAEPLDLTLVPNIRTTMPAEAGTVRGPVRLGAVRTGSSPTVEETPLPPPAIPRATPQLPPADPAALPAAAGPEAFLTDRTVFMPGRQIAALLDGAGAADRPADTPEADDPALADTGPVPAGETGTEAPAPEPVGVEALEVQPEPLPADPVAEDEGDVTAKVSTSLEPDAPSEPAEAAMLVDDFPPADAEAGPEVIPEPEFDPDRTVVLPRRALNVSWRPKPLPKASPFEVPDLTAPAPLPVQERPSDTAAARPPAVDPATWARVQSAIPDVAQALTTYLGPIARVLVKRHAERCDSPEALVESVAMEIPAEAERQAFRDRAAILVARLG